MSIHHYPTLPVGVMQIHMRWRPASPDGAILGPQRAVFSFINQNPFPPGWVPTSDPAFPTLAWLDGALGGTVPFDTSPMNYYWFFQGPAGFYHQFNPGVISGASNGYCYDPALCVCYSKFASPRSKNTTGRMHLMPVPSNFWDHGVIRASAEALYVARAANLAAPINWDGIIFSPAIYSNQLDVYNTIDEIRYIPIPRYVYRRRANRSKFVALWTFVP